MLAAFNWRAKRQEALLNALKRVDKLTSRYGKIRYWLEKEYDRYASLAAFDSDAIRDCGWVLKTSTKNNEAVLIGHVTPRIALYFSRPYHDHLEWGGMRLALADNDLYLNGPVEILSRYIMGHRLVVSLGDIDDTIRKRTEELDRLVRLRSQFER